MSEHFPAVEHVMTRAEILKTGVTPWQLRRAVSEGRLIRLRRDRYVAAPDARIDEAASLGGRVTCISLLAWFGVFVRVADVLHVHVHRNASRIRGRRSRKVRLHWHRLLEPPPFRHAVGIADATRCAVRCLEPRDAIATLDSVLHLGLMTLGEVREMFASLPGRYAALLPLLDGRAESGIESLVRLMLRQVGAEVSVQVQIATVGRVDLVVGGWLIVECDSRQFHEGWDRQREDRRRDLAAVRLGYVVIRLLAEDVLYAPEEVRAALADVLARGRAR